MSDLEHVSRHQFLVGSASVVFGAFLGKLSDNLLPDTVSLKWRKSNVELEEEWQRLPLDILSGASLVCDSDSAGFGGTEENEEGLLTQYFHVCPGLALQLSPATTDGRTSGWVGYNRELLPVWVPSVDEVGSVISVPNDVAFLRGSCSREEGTPAVKVRNLAEYILLCDIRRPDLTGYTEMTDLTVYSDTRRDEDGRFSEGISAYPALGDVFFVPSGTEIIVTFQNANIAPYLHCGENYRGTDSLGQFRRCYGFGFSWYTCRTTEVCNWLGACYETVNGNARPLTRDELLAAEPHLYIRFPGSAVRTEYASKIRTMGLLINSQRWFTVVHATDTHGDMDSTQALCEYAGQIDADFVAFTGDYVPCFSDHGFDMLQAVIRQGKAPAVLSIGNHDVKNRSDTEVYDTLIAPIRDTLQASDAHAYYYRDFTWYDDTVRVISLYPFCDRAKNRWYGYYTQEQLLWLCDALASVPDGGHILILRHFSHNRPEYWDYNKTMFYDFMSNPADTENLWLNMDEDPITAIVDAYNRREYLSARFIGQLNDGEETVSVDYDFSSRPNSEFVAYIVGHVHRDAVGYARYTRTRQLVLTSLCTTGVKGSDEYHSFARIETARDYGTDSQIAFNVFTFDFSNKTVRVARVGNGTFQDQEKTWMEISYQ